MKKLIAVVMLSVFAVSAQAAIKCVRNADGSMCCWDTAVEGPFKPLSCY
jgi:hypothetical protein